MSREEAWWLRTLAVAIAAMVALAVMCGCTRRVYVPVESAVSRTDTLRQYSARVDSVLQRDSVAVYINGDTVRITQWRDRLRYVLRTDTVHEVRVDSVSREVPVEVEVVREVERPLRWWQKGLMWGGGLLLVALTALIGAWILRRRLR